MAGFFACHIHPIYFYKLHRFEGQYLYLNSAKLGLLCFVIALLLVISYNFFIPDTITLGGFVIEPRIAERLVNVATELWEKDNESAKKTVWFFILSLLTFLSAYLLKFYSLLTLWIRCGTFNRDHINVFVMASILEESPLDNLLYKSSLDPDETVMLTMNDRKVYVGKIITLGETSETVGMDQEILIMPILSGYRDKDTLQIKFTTYYSDVESDVESELTLTLRQEAIVSATAFDFAAYEVWNPNKETA